MIDIGFVIGNGESRKSFDLTSLVGHGPIYGCNALYRDYPRPDLLVAGDTPMTEEIRKNYEGNFYEIKLDSWVEAPIKYPHTRVALPPIVNGSDTNWYAGVTATWLMCHINHHMRYVYLIGFDIYGSIENRNLVNNLYKDTPNYCPADFDHAPRLNIDRHTKSLSELVFKAFPGVQFHRVGNCNDEFPRFWKDCPNVGFMSYEEFNARLKGLTG